MGKTWWCQCCNNHRSGYLRQCSCCERWIAPGCSPEKCLMLDKQHGAPYNLCKKCVTLAIYIILFLLPPQAENHNYNHRKKRRLNEIEWSLSMYVCGSLAAARKSPQETVKMMQLMFRCGHDDFLDKFWAEVECNWTLVNSMSKLKNSADSSNYGSDIDRYINAQMLFSSWCEVGGWEPKFSGIKWSLYIYIESVNPCV